MKGGPLAELPRDLVSTVERAFGQIDHSFHIEVPSDWLPPRPKYPVGMYGHLSPGEAATLTAQKLKLRPDLDDRHSQAAMLALMHALMCLRRAPYNIEVPTKLAVEKVIDAVADEYFYESAIDLVDVFGLKQLRVPDATYSTLEKETRDLLVRELSSRLFSAFLKQKPKPQRRDPISPSRRERLDKAV